MESGIGVKGVKVKESNTSRKSSDLAKDVVSPSNDREQRRSPHKKDEEKYGQGAASLGSKSPPNIKSPIKPEIASATSGSKATGKSPRVKKGLRQDENIKNGSVSKKKNRVKPASPESAKKKTNSKLCSPPKKITAECYERADLTKNIDKAKLFEPMHHIVGAVVHTATELMKEEDKADEQFHAEMIQGQDAVRRPHGISGRLTKETEHYRLQAEKHLTEADRHNAEAEQHMLEMAQHAEKAVRHRLETDRCEMEVDRVRMERRKVRVKLFSCTKRAQQLKVEEAQKLMELQEHKTVAERHVTEALRHINEAQRHVTESRGHLSRVHQELADVQPQMFEVQQYITKLQRRLEQLEQHPGGDTRGPLSDSVQSSSNAWSLEASPRRLESVSRLLKGAAATLGTTEIDNLPKSADPTAEQYVYVCIHVCACGNNADSKPAVDHLNGNNNPNNNTTNNIQ